MPRAFPTHRVRHVVTKGVKADINNNLSERLQGTIRDRDKTLRGLKARDTGQAYVDGLVTHYNYFRTHESLKGKAGGSRGRGTAVYQLVGCGGHEVGIMGIIEPCLTMAASAAMARRNG